MNSLNKSIALAVSLFLACACFGAPVSLSRLEATNLHAVLNSIQTGLSPTNAINVADDINVLLPIAQSYAKGQQAAQRAQVLLVGSDQIEKLARQIALSEEVERKGEEILTLELTLIEITADEIKEAKLAPGALAVVRRYLSATAPPKK